MWFDGWLAFSLRTDPSHLPALLAGTFVFDLVVEMCECKVKGMSTIV